MLKQDLTLETFKQTDYCLGKKINKSIGLMKDELGEEIIEDFDGLRAKAYSHLKSNSNFPPNFFKFFSMKAL